jgi:prepilin-type N-terminal cleavage/methylation domain-containing protein
MITNCLLQRIARLKKRSGFTLVELLVVIAIIAILAGVALGPITNGIKQAKHNTAMQGARTVGQLCFNYATDNTTGGNRYPWATGNTAAAIATLLVTSGYATDGAIFVVNGQAGVSPSSSTTIIASNISWSFTSDVGGTQGLLNCGDGIPVVYFNNGQGASIAPTWPAPGAAVTVGTTAPQGQDGVAVYYKGNNATYIKSTTAGSCPAFIPASCTDTATYVSAP